jgi:hypothetical protein
MFEANEALFRRISSGLCAITLALGLSACGASVAPGPDSGTDRDTGVGSDVAADRVVLPPPIDAGGECRASMVRTVLAPTVLFAGQPLGLTVNAPGLGCSCALELRPNGLSSARGFDPQLCNCCRDCECVDESYTASVLLGSPRSGQSDLAVTGSERRRVFVLDSPRQCEAVSVRVRTVLVQAPEGRTTGPRLHWAIVSGTHRICCDGGVGFVDSMQRNTITLEPQSCETVGCAMACPPIAQRPERPFTSAHLLGGLPNGEYRLSVGGTTVTFTVAP